ncbi:MAG: N-acetylmuramoyl-L-alanine amidase [Leptothrix sp. (in: b-proteobacteria)]
MNRPPPTDSALPDHSRRRWLQRSSALTLGAAQPAALLLLTAPQIAHGASIVAVRVWPAADYTRVTIESDGALPAQHFTTEDPPRLVIDIAGMELSPQLRELAAKVRGDDPHIARVRVGQNQPNRVRLVLDLKQSSTPQVFALAPVAPYRYRLVFDLYPSQPPDPLLLLVRERENALRNASATATESTGATNSSNAASAVNDALGEFIGQVRRPSDEPAEAAAPTPPPASDSSSPMFQRLPEPALRGDRPGPRATDTERSASARSNPDSGTSRPAAAEAQTEAAPPTGQAGINRLIIVALDPGHGGEDPGAIGPTGLREKDVVLSIALQLAERINAHPGMRAMLTRDNDYFVPLQERVHKARQVQADLFISIHADAFLTPKAHGASVFALSDSGATSTTARWMARRENASDAIGGINIAAKDSHVLRALLDMSTTRQIKDSLKLGSEVLGHIGQIGKLHRGQVEQAGFAVLKAPDIPSILVETAFISNPDEETKLRSATYQARMVRALMSGIQRYFAKNPPLTRNRML